MNHQFVFILTAIDIYCLTVLTFSVSHGLTCGQAWAALEYLDKVLGRLFDYLAASGLEKTTYVMLLSDNGSALLPNEGSKANRMVRHSM